MNDPLRNFTERVVGNIDSKHNSARFDPTIILLIMELLSTIIPQIIEWCDKTPEDIPQMAKSPTWLQRRVLVTKTRRVLGRRAYREYGPDVVNALLKTGAQATSKEIEELYNTIDS